MKAFLGVDLGTTGCKGAVYALDGQLISLKYYEIPLVKINRQQIEQDPDIWWNVSSQVIRETAYDAAQKSLEIIAISISSQGISFVPVDKQGNPLHNAITWLDTRAENEIQQITSVFPPSTIFKKTGKRPESYYTLPKLMWLKENEQDIYHNTACFMSAHDYIYHKLTGEFLTDFTLAGGTMMLDLQQYEWWQELLDYVEIDTHLLPKLNQSGVTGYPILKHVAESLGLPEKILVITGGQDQKCSAFGAGLKENIATISLGTASAITAIANFSALYQEQCIPIFPYIESNTLVFEGVLGTSGAAYKWVKETFFTQMDYPSLNKIASIAPPGSNGTIFLPHLSGASCPHWDSDATATFTGLHLASSPSDIIRSVLEGIAYQIRANLEVIQSYVSLESLILFGGGAKSSFWTEIICNVTNKAVYYSPAPEMALLGACLLAAKGTGYQEEIEAAFPRLEPMHTPDQYLASQYEELFQKYRNTENKLLHS